jgi:hypothetical protein
MVKDIFVTPCVSEGRRRDFLGMIREVMATDYKTFVYHLPLPSQQDVYVHYPLEEQKDNTLLAAHQHYQKIMKTACAQLPVGVRDKIHKEIPGILPQTLN